MTGNTRLMGASAPETLLTGKGKAVVPQKTLPDRYPALLPVLNFSQERTYSRNGRTQSPERATKEDQDGVDEDPDVQGSEADSDPFTPTQCLFCSTTSPDFESNLSHMNKRHSLFIPAAIDNEALTLAVDLETLVRYMHLVISTYNECLLCHTQRQSAHAVRQHMTGKGHCRIDLEDGGSEFRDFYESASGVGNEDEGGSSGEETLGGSEDEAEAVSAGGEPLRLREGGLLLASGKLLSHRSAPAPKHHRPLSETQKTTRRGALASASSTPASQPSEDGTGPSPTDSTPDTTTTTPAADNGRALTRLERRAEASGKSALAIAMSRMSLNDRAALAHLPAAEQRAVVLRQFKQQDRARHEARRFWSKVELRGNKTAKK